MPAHLFLKLETAFWPIAGGSLNADYRDWIEIIDVRFVGNSLSPMSQQVGRPRPRNVVAFTKHKDGASRGLMGIRGETCTLAILVRVGDGSRDPGGWWSFGDAVLNNFTVGHDGVEEFMLSCLDVEYGVGSYVRLSAVPKATAAIVHGAIGALRKFVKKR